MSTLTGQFAAKKGGMVPRGTSFAGNNSRGLTPAYWVGEMINLGSHVQKVESSKNHSQYHQGDPENPFAGYPEQASATSTNTRGKLSTRAKRLNYQSFTHANTTGHGSPALQQAAYGPAYGPDIASAMEMAQQTLPMQAATPGFVTANPMVDFDGDGNYENLGPIEHTSYYQTLHDQTHRYFYDAVAFGYDEVNRDYRETMQKYAVDTTVSWFNYKRDRQEIETFWNTLGQFAEPFGAGLAKWGDSLINRDSSKSKTPTTTASNTNTSSTINGGSLK